MMVCPKVIVLISGKRKSGKDYLAERLQSEFSSRRINTIVLRISAPLKKEFARLHHLPFDRLLESGPYKEDFRKEMVRWSDEFRRKDPFYFCRLAATEAAESSRACIWIVADIRRPADIRYFEETFAEKSGVSVLKVRLLASEESRVKRGWKFEPGVDDAETECALDDPGIAWDFVVVNDDVSHVTEDESPFLLSFRRLVDRVCSGVDCQNEFS